MEIVNTRRILAVSLASSVQHLARVTKDLTGTAPEQTSTSLAGSTHTLSLKTAYYTAEVPIWLDLIASPSEWSGSFLSPEAKEVLDVLGAVMVVFSLPSNLQSAEAEAAKELISHVGKVVKDGLGGWEWDGVGLCLGVGEVGDVDEWDDLCADVGLEFVQVRNQNVSARNEFGEKTGIPRALEALQSNDWSHSTADDLGLDDIESFEAELGLERESRDDAVNDLDPENLDFGFDREDFAGLKRAIWSADKDAGEGVMNKEPPGKEGNLAVESKGDDEEGTPQMENPPTVPKDIQQEQQREQAEEKVDDDEVRKIERMMIKLQAVRDSNAGLPEEQRKRVAAKAVAEVMKEL